MLFVYILLGLLGAVLLALLVPVYGRVVYDGEQLRVRVRVLGVPITLLPRPEKARPDTGDKPRRTGKGKKPAPSKWQELTQMFREDGPAATLHYLSELARLAGQAVGRLLRAVTVDKLHLELLVATADPSDTAVRYGQVCGVLYPALAAISGPVRIRRRQVRVEPNFLLEKSDVRLDVRLHVGVYRLLWAAIVVLVRFLVITDSEENKEVM